MSYGLSSPSRGGGSQGSGMGYHTKRHLGHLQSHAQLYCGPRVPFPQDKTNPISVGGYEEVGSPRDSNQIDNAPSKDRALSRELKATKQRLGFVANASNTHNTNTGEAKNRAMTMRNATMPNGAGAGETNLGIPMGEGMGTSNLGGEPVGPVVQVTVPSGEVAKVNVDDATVGGLRDFFSNYGDNFFANIRRRECFTAQANFLGHTNLSLNQVCIPPSCIRITPISDPKRELRNDSQPLAEYYEFDYKFRVSRVTKQFAAHEDLFSLEDIEDCRIYLYQNVREQEMNRLSPCPLTKSPSCSLLHQLIKRRREAACLALLEDTVRLRRETLNHAPNMETALMAACRAGLPAVAVAILDRADFGVINNAECHFKTDVNFQPRSDVSELKSMEGSIVPDGAYTALDLACIHKLDDVACCICARDDFVEVNNLSPGNYTSLMHAVHNELPKAACAILARPDFRVLKARNTQAIECSGPSARGNPDARGWHRLYAMDGACAILARPDFRVLKARNTQAIECTAYQMAKKKAERPWKLPVHDPDAKRAVLDKCEVFQGVCRRMEKHPAFVLDLANKFTRA